MADSSDILGVIPARWDSKRFPGKPLVKLHDKPLIQWVWERAVQVNGVSQWLVATDDSRISDAVQAFGGQALMTSTEHQSGTDRIIEVIQHYPHQMVVNIQGDEPLLNPRSVEIIIQALASDPEAAVSTAAFPIQSKEELNDPNVVKVAVSKNHRALMFTRAAIPHIRDQASRSAWTNLRIHYRHLGVYAYRRKALLTYSQWKPGPLETAEKLEQLRFLEHGAVVACPLVEDGSPGVDTPEDLRNIERLLPH